MEILSDHGLLLRWLHIVAGIMWIGMLWFFNFVNGPFQGALDAETKGKVGPQLMPRALWWFRWGAAFTWVSGVAYAWIIAKADPTPALGGSVMKWFLETQRGNWVFMGFLFGTVMAFNVWFVIWPRQRKIIGSTIRKENPPEKAGWIKVATNASRLNTFLSIPLIMFMAAAKHSGEFGGDMTTNVWASATIVSLVGFAFAWLFIFKVGPSVGKDFKG